jgi:hypothetical protein
VVREAGLQETDGVPNIPAVSAAATVPTCGGILARKDHITTGHTPDEVGARAAIRR